MLTIAVMSANGQTSIVMKGITHGACDYLLKPVRLEELQNIWQHVVRRRSTQAKVGCALFIIGCLAIRGAEVAGLHCFAPDCQKCYRALHARQMREMHLAYSSG